MVTFVVIHNFLLGLACLFAAQQVLRLRQKLAKISDTILYVEGVMRGFLHYAPTAVQKAQRGTAQLHDRYTNLEIYYARLQQIVSLISVGRFLWRSRPVGAAPKSTRTGTKQPGTKK